MFSKLRTIAAGLTVAVVFGAHAQSAYPSRPIVLVVPVSAGGVTDQMARAFADGIGRVLKTSVVVENKPGGNGVLGANFVAHSAPDGYTVCFCHSGPVTLAKISMGSLPYDIDKAFTPVTRVYDLSPIIAVPTKSPYKTLDDLLKAAREKPGMSYGHTGVGGALHLGMEGLRLEAKVDMTAVPYQGETPMVPDLLTGRLDSGLLSPLLAKSQAGAGNVRLLASLGSPSPIEGVPAVVDIGFPKSRASTWAGFFVPSATPKAVVQTLYDAIQATARTPEMHDRLMAAGLTPVVGQTPDQFKIFVNDEKRHWADVVKKIGGPKD